MSQHRPDPFSERGGDFTRDLYNPACATGGRQHGDQSLRWPTTVYPGEVFDPSTQQVVNGTPCRSPFAGNKITSPTSSTVANKRSQLHSCSDAAGPMINNFWLSLYAANQQHH